MKLILTRHGRTEENEAGILQGHLPGKLTLTGIHQAQKVALRLRDEKIDHIYSSDLARASDTANEIARYHSGTPITFVGDLREKFLGEWQGKRKIDLWFSVNTATVAIAPKDGETSEALFLRASNFLDKILLKHSNDTVLFVAHQGINKALVSVIAGKTHEEIKNVENLNNTSICIFEIDENKNYEIHTFNCSKHLQ